MACRNEDAVIRYTEVNARSLSENYWYGPACCTADFARSRTKARSLVLGIEGDYW